MDNSKQENFALALHEAGHAVVCERLGIPIVSVRLLDRGDRSGCALDRSGFTVHQHTHDLWKRVVISAAGLHTECSFLHLPLNDEEAIHLARLASVNDFRSVIRSVRQYRVDREFNPTFDPNKILTTTARRQWRAKSRARFRKADIATAHDLWRKAGNWLDGLLKRDRDFISQIRSVANTLYERGALSGVDVRELMTNATAVTTPPATSMAV